MGVTITSKNFSIDMGYGGFDRLRKKVAELTNEEINAHYKDLDKGAHLLDNIERMKFFEIYDKKINELAELYHKQRGILEFLYMSDCNGSLAFTKCKQIYKVIESYDDNIAYGYIGRPDCAMFKDFKKIIKDCIDNKCRMSWS